MQYGNANIQKQDGMDGGGGNHAYRLSCRDLGGVSLWYCVLLAAWGVWGYGGMGVWGYAPQRKLVFLLLLYKVASEAILVHFSSLVNPSLQLHMYVMSRGQRVTKEEREQLLPTLFHPKENIMASLTVI